jgi:exocyst complex component 3
VANNHLKCAEFLETLQKHTEPFLEDRYKQEFDTKMNDTREGFSKVTKKSVTCLVDIVMRDVNPALAATFTGGWYEQRTMGSVIATFQDYFPDFKTTLQDYLFTKFLTECLDRFLLGYLETFRSKSAKFKMPDALQLAKEDLETCILFWSEYRPAKRVKQSFDVFEKILSLLEASGPLVFLSWYSLWKAYKDVPMSFVEDLLSKRSDLDRSAVKEAMTNCKAKASEGPSEGETSLFSKLSQ